MNPSAFLYPVRPSKRSPHHVVLQALPSFETQQRRAQRLLRVPSEIIEHFKACPTQDLWSFYNGRKTTDLMKAHGFVPKRAIGPFDHWVRPGLIIKASYLTHPKPPARAIPTLFLKRTKWTGGIHVVAQPVAEEIGNVMDFDHMPETEFGQDAALRNLGRYQGELVVFDW